MSGPPPSTVASRLLAAQAVAAEDAEETDRLGKFPKRALDALKGFDLLGPFDPDTGAPWDATRLLNMVASVAAACGSTGLVYAMHHVVMHTLRRAAEDDVWLTSFVQRSQNTPGLLASASSEKGVGGDMSQSVAACETLPNGNRRVVKQATAASYLVAADGVTITARRDPSARPTDQVMVVAERDQFTAAVDPNGWNAFGMRGTASGGARIECTVSEEQVVKKPWPWISSQVQMPISHLLWASCWTGVARSAVLKARGHLRDVGRQTGDLATTKRVEFADLLGALTRIERQTADLALAYDACVHERARLDEQLLFELVRLRLDASEAAIDIVRGSLRVIGVGGFIEGAPHSVCRELRDVLSSCVMITDARVRAQSSALAMAATPLRKGR
jgi:acyl-CoA dehydrogenase